MYVDIYIKNFSLPKGLLLDREINATRTTARITNGVENPVEGVVDSSTEVVELFSGAGVSRQRICTAALCRSVYDIEQHDMKSVVDSSTEVVELFSGSEVSRQRICTAALCRSVCQSLGFPISFCNIQLICVCRR
ncbi:unnamed protein product [Leptidea sinapis]|uniref:Uncharacterized protein n=1 Tax=Leptidea sinapis TaxID=189913 RepID=A0A5E4PXX9_9NEOP|nr:unnamed protein product [Leptidea sinapis]